MPAPAGFESTVQPYQGIARSTRPALRTLAPEAYKALIQLTLLKSPGMTIYGHYETLAELIGSEIRTLKRILPLLHDLKLIRLTVGKPRGQGRGWGPMKIIVLPLPTCADFAGTDFAPASDLEAICNGSGTVPQAVINSETRNTKQEVGDACAPPRTTPPTPTGEYPQGEPDDDHLPVVVLDDPSDLHAPQANQPSTPDADQTPAPVAGDAARVLAALQREFRVNLAAGPDTHDRWILETQGLTVEHLRGIYAMRTLGQVIRWPSEFAKLRAAWVALLAQRQEYHQRQAKAATTRKAQAEASTAWQRAAERDAHDDALRQARKPFLATPWGKIWSSVSTLWAKTPGPHRAALMGLDTWPTALDGEAGVLTLRVGPAFPEALAEDPHFLAVLGQGYRMTLTRVILTRETVPV